MSTLDKAIRIAAIAHEGQIDKGGNPYILHPLRVMMRLYEHTDDIKIVAVLHDVFEDCDVSVRDLEEEGFSKTIIDAIVALTRRKDETYMDFIKRVKNNPIAKLVKIADIEDNMNLMRIPEPTENDYERNKRYHKALDYLLS